MASSPAPIFLALGCVGFIASAPAAAAELPSGDTDADASGTGPEIIVAGQRDRGPGHPKAVAPIDTPRSLVVLDSETLRQTGASSLTDALRLVPGITFGAAEGGNPIGDRPFIRGFDSQGSIYVDGVRDFAAQSREIFAVDSIQVVRGSDSTLGGRGSAGGTINIVSKLPQSEDFEAAQASFGNADYKRATFDINRAIAPGAAFRIEGLWHDQDFAGRDSIWMRRWGVAPSLIVGLGSPTRLTLSYYHLTSHELPDSGIPYLYTIANAPGTGNIDTQPALGHVTTIAGATGNVDRSTFYGLVGRDFRNTNVDQATLRVEHDFGRVTLRNTMRFTHNEQDYIYTQPDDSQGNVFGTNPASPATAGGLVWRRANTRYGHSDALTDQTDLFGTFTTGGVKHNFSLGTELDWEDARRGTYALASGATFSPRCNAAALARSYCTSLFNPNPLDPWTYFASDTSSATTSLMRGGPATETRNKAQTASFYGFDSINLLPKLILNLGARFDHFRSTITPPITPVGAFSLSRTDNLFNWQAGLVFKPLRDTSLYVSYATAATPPNSLLGEGREDNALPTTDTSASVDLLNSLKVQKTRSWEAGAKADLFHDRLSLAADIFRTMIDNARVTDENNAIAFIGKTRIRGFEITASGRILPGWTLFGGYTHLDPRIVDGGFTALTAAAVGGRAAQIVLVPSVNTGKQIPQVARDSITAWTNVSLPKGISFGLGAFYTSRQFGGYADNRSAVQNGAGVVTVNPATKTLLREIPGYWRFDARAAWQVTKAMELSVTAQNLTDKAYFSQTFTNHYATIAPGRTVFGTLSVKFR
ncbi:MAG TPA: TonB-dependent receptor [Allosphingosinicella sp.]|nr:TonB-dependent receptor [Allosphingosinicella sp.]